jgi:hypothetical protein
MPVVEEKEGRGATRMHRWSGMGIDGTNVMRIEGMGTRKKEKKEAFYWVVFANVIGISHD